MHAMNKARWTQDEDDYVRAAFPSTPWTEMQNKLKRSKPAIVARAVKLGLNRRCRWLPDEIQMLRSDYPTTSWDDLEVKFNRSRESIADKANALGLRRYRRPARIKKQCTTLYRRPAATISAVRRMRGHSYGQIAAHVGVTRNTVAGIVRDYGWQT